jgi:uncharacterized protein YeaO (DUF488 family)
MLKQGSVADVKNGIIKREDGHVVITMRFYPRFLRKEMRDEFVCDLAPEKELLREFNEAQKRLGNHNNSFAEVDYERRFQLEPRAMAHLKRLCALSAKRDVFLICICELGEMCHREMLMLLGKHLLGCQVDTVFHNYPVFMDRMGEFAARFGR